MGDPDLVAMGQDMLDVEAEVNGTYLSKNAG